MQVSFDVLLVLLCFNTSLVDSNLIISIVNYLLNILAVLIALLVILLIKKSKFCDSIYSIVQW